MPFITTEAKNLVTKLSGLSVVDVNAPGGVRKVQTNFKFPEEDTIDTVYPNILIEHSGIRKADEREHRGEIWLPYVPEQMQGQVYNLTDPTTGAPIPYTNNAAFGHGPLYEADHPIPYDLDFDVEVNCRFRNHRDQLLNQLLTVDYLPHRFGYLNIVEDQTQRSLFVIGSELEATGSDENGARLFKSIFKVRVATELHLYQIQYVQNYIEKISLQMDVNGILGKDKVSYGNAPTGYTNNPYGYAPYGF